jgi:NADPH:quinone reductase-like Zn-dependent oxidoreductase
MLGQPNEELAKKHEVTAIGQGTKTITENLVQLTELVESDNIKVHIERVFPLDETKEAFAYQENNHPQGKIVIKIK